MKAIRYPQRIARPGHNIVYAIYPSSRTSLTLHLMESLKPTGHGVVAKENKMTKIFAVSGGFYFFGTEVSAPEGYLALKDAAMFGSFAGGKGLPGVSRGDKSATVTLDRFAAGEELVFPVTAVFAVFPTIDLYTFKGATLR